MGLKLQTLVSISFSMLFEMEILFNCHLIWFHLSQPASILEASHGPCQIQLRREKWEVQFRGFCSLVETYKGKAFLCCGIYLITEFIGVPSQICLCFYKNMTFYEAKRDQWMFMVFMLITRLLWFNPTNGFLWNPRDLSRWSVGAYVSRVYVQLLL